MVARGKGLPHAMSNMLFNSRKSIVIRIELGYKQLRVRATVKNVDVGQMLKASNNLKKDIVNQS